MQFNQQFFLLIINLLTTKIFLKIVKNLRFEKIVEVCLCEKLNFQ